MLQSQDLPGKAGCRLMVRMPALLMGSKNALEKTCIQPARTISSGLTLSSDSILAARAASYFWRPSATFCSSFSPLRRKPSLMRLK